MGKKEENKIVSFDGYKNKKEKKQNEFKKGLSVVVKQPIEGQEAKKQQIRDFQIEKKKEKRIEQRNKRVVMAGVSLAGAIAAAVGIVGCEQTKEQKEQEQAKYVKKLVEQNTMENEEMTKEEIIRKVVDAMEITEDVKNFMNNMYIELTEQQTGNTELTTENIEFADSRSCQNLAYLDEEKNEIILHSGDPYGTIEKLKKAGISYNTIEDVDVYRVRKNGETIDTMAYKAEKYYQAKEGAQYEQYDENYISILQKMGRVVPTGLEYARKIEATNISDNDKILLKNQFISSLEKFFEKENEVEMENLIPDEPIEQDEEER